MIISHGKQQQQYLLYLAIGIGIFLKIYLVLGLPRFIYGHAVHDDSLLLNYANNLLSHNWMGGVHLDKDTTSIPR